MCVSLAMFVWSSECLRKCMHVCDCVCLYGNRVVFVRVPGDVCIVIVSVCVAVCVFVNVCVLVWRLCCVDMCLWLCLNGGRVCLHKCMHVCECVCLYGDCGCLHKCMHVCECSACMVIVLSLAMFVW